MCEQVETLPTPNWLTELESKRERRVRARLGHDIGAGAPCLVCPPARCPAGLDLHFWRKICKVCKCGKESHDVADDDVHNWAEFQLLGSRPSKTRPKVVLPGRSNEVELEWAPKGNETTISNYLKTLPPEQLPVKGSEAAFARKQMLQKQIPIHDIDPTLCHELSDTEKMAMDKYIEHMKSNSVGVGKIVQFEPLPKTISTTEMVHTIQPQQPIPLAKHFDELAIQDQRELDAFFDKIPKPSCMTLNPRWPTYNAQNPTFKDYANSNLANFTPENTFTPIENNQTPTSVKIGGIKDVIYENIDNFSGGDEMADCFKGKNCTIEEDDAGNECRKKCKNCKKNFETLEFAIFAERPNCYYHADCFRCTGCNQNLADNMYFYDRESDSVYCLRDYAKIRGYQRCKACDELIFVKEYCLAENSSFHVRHFCCYECDQALVGQKYVVEDSQPYCFACFERCKGARCQGCMAIIKPDEQGAELNGLHFHPTDVCFACDFCRKPLLKAKLLLRNGKLFCSHDCFNKRQQVAPLV